MKRVICFFIFSIFIFSCKEKRRANLSNHEKTELDSFLEKANDFQLTKKERLYFTNKAYSILKQKDEDSISIQYLFKIADRFYNVDENNDFFQISKEILKQSEKTNDSLNIAKSLNYLADFYYYTFRNDSAYYYYAKAEKLYSKVKKDNLNNRILYNKASILLFEKNFSQSEADMIEVLERAKRDCDERLVYDCYLSLGMSSRGMKNYPTAIKYYKKAFKQTDKLTNDPQYLILKAQPLNYIALALQNENKFSEALSYSNKALDMDSFKIKDPAVYCYFRNTLAYSKFKHGYERSQQMFEETLKIGDSLDNLYVQLNSKLYLSEYYLSKNKIEEAKKFSNDVKELAHSKNVFEDELKALELLAKIDVKNSSKYREQYISLNDSLQNVERATRNKFARIEFETDEITNQKNTVEAEKEEISGQRWIILGFSLFFIVLIIFLYVSHRQRSKNRELQYLQQQQKANEEIYRLMLDQQQKIEEGKRIEKRRISKELHDGVMGKLTAIRLNLFVLGKKTDPETIARCLEHVDEIQNIEKEIRKISHDLNQNLFTDTSDFTQMVNNLVDNIKEHSDIRFSIITDEKIDWNTIDSSVKMQVYRILQEALQNIMKYAKAKNVVISMLEKEQKFSVTISDDGIGFDTNSNKNGIGHKNMRERAAEINGEIEIISNVGKGVAINLIIPT